MNELKQLIEACVELGLDIVIATDSESSSVFVTVCDDARDEGSVEYATSETTVGPTRGKNWSPDVLFADLRLQLRDDLETWKSRHARALSRLAEEPPKEIT